MTQPLSPIGAYRSLRPLLFLLPPERAHQLSLELLRALSLFSPGRTLLRHLGGAQNAPVEIDGLSYPNRVGLAAGYDKNARAVLALSALGFGQIEIGTVTPKPQQGNSGLRLKREPARAALFNRLGFPSLGAEVVYQRLDQFWETFARSGHTSAHPRSVIGVNIGKNRGSSEEEAAADYLIAFARLAPVADYLTINVSSPNTEGLRALQAPTQLTRLIEPILEQRAKLGLEAKPIYIKLAPDLERRERERIILTLAQLGVDGVILSNTRAVQRDLLRGGESGAPLRAQTLQTLNEVRALQTPLTLIASGGVGASGDLHTFREAGAALIQLWTALIYRGPRLLRVL